jgi:hypothetical protein
LISKAALAEIWSLAPVIDITDRIIAPFDSRLKHTGKHLRDVSLRTTRDFPSIVKHLDANCPHLDRFGFTISILRSFSKFDKQMARLLSRVSRLTIFETDSPLRKPDPSVDDFPALHQLLVDANKIKQVSITHIHFDFEPKGWNRQSGHLKITDLLQSSLMSVLLYNVAPDYDMRPDSMIDAVKHCESLRELQYQLIEEKPNLKLLGQQIIQTLSGTRVGLNVTYIRLDPSRSEQPLLPTLLAAVGCDGVIEILETAHLNHAIHPRHCAQIMAHYCTEKPLQIDALMISLTNHVFKSLPPLADVLPYLYEVGFWETAVNSLPEASFIALSARIGPPIVDSFSVACSLVSRSDFSTKIAERLKSYGLLGSTHFLTLSDRHNLNIFSYAGTPAALDWILSQISREDAVRLLHQSSNTSSFSPFASYIAHQMKTIEFLISRVGEKAVLSVTDAAQQRLIASQCAHLSDTSFLARIVTATGLSNFSSEARGGILWDLYHLSVDDNNYSPFFTYWFDLVEKDRSVEPDLWADDGLNLVFHDTPRAGEARMDLILTKFTDVITRQGSKTSSRSAPLMTRIVKLLFYCQSNPRRAANLDQFAIVEKIFTPLARANASFGESALAILASATTQFFRGTNANQAVFEPLFQICYDIDFAPDATEAQRRTRRLKIARFMHSIDLKHYSSCIIYLERLLDLLSAEYLNDPSKTTGDNLMDVILSAQNGPLLPNIGDLIMRLVERGGRSRSRDRSQLDDRKFDVQALEIYYDAIRVLSQHSPK